MTEDLGMDSPLGPRWPPLSLSLSLSAHAHSIQRDGRPAGGRRGLEAGGSG